MGENNARKKPRGLWEKTRRREKAWEAHARPIIFKNVPLPRTQKNIRGRNEGERQLKGLFTAKDFLSGPEKGKGAAQREKIAWGNGLSRSSRRGGHEKKEREGGKKFSKRKDYLR